MFKLTNFNSNILTKKGEKRINAIKKLLDTRKVVLVTGARQVGKSTFIKSMKDDDRTYITLDDLTLRNLAQNDPKLFLMNYPGKIIIDEVQYAPNLFPYIKMDVDSNAIKGKYWLTGSQRFSLMENVTESLAGRVAILELSSLSYAEKKGFTSRIFNPENLKSTFVLNPQEVFNEIYKGGMPLMIIF